MLTGINQLRSYGISCLDGHLGMVEDFYLEDASWIIRYVVVDTGGWLVGRQVLISPASVRRLDHVAMSLEVSLTKQQIEQSPGVDAHLTLSRAHEMSLAEYFDWPRYWDRPIFAELNPATRVEHGQPATAPVTSAQSCLRSVRDIIGYHIQASDGKIGHIDDFVVRDEDWMVRYLVADTRNWLPGRRVLVAPHWVKQIDWTQKLLWVDMPKSAIAQAPPYNPRAFRRTDYEQELAEVYSKMDYRL